MGRGAAPDSFWKSGRWRRCARRLGQRRAGLKIFAVGGGWGSAHHGCGGASEVQARR
jgi:hypothetical protein